jgi:hypothetical protein
MYNKDSKEIYKRYLLSEVSQSDLNEIKYQRQLSSLPFNNIFDGKYRVILPVIADEIFDTILDKIQQCQAFKFDHFDFAKEKVMLELPVDEKFKHLVKGKKLRAESLNSVIAKMEQAGCVTPEEAAEYSKWVIRFSGEGLRSMGEQSYIILSRSPVDIVRMSDISGIDSCHGKGGRFYNCALDEAKQDAGFVGFLVKPEQLQIFSKEEIENNLEIFADGDRGVQGMKAFGRIRIRSIDIKGNNPIGVTEPVIYGISKMKNQGNTIQLPGVFSTVRRFLRQKQNLPTVDQFKHLFKNGDVRLLGGSYLDSESLQSLVGNFYDSEGDFEGDEDVVEDRATMVERELQTIHRQSGIDEVAHVSAGFDVNDDDGGGADYVYYYAYGSITIDLSNYDVDLSTFDDSYDTYEVRRMTDDRGGKNKDVALFFKTLKDTLKSEASVDFYEVHGIGFNHRGDTIYLEKSISGDESSYATDPDDYYTFTRGLIDWSERYDDFVTAVLIALRKIGAYNPAKHEYDTNEEINEEQFKYIEYDDESSIGEMYLDGSEMFNNKELFKNYSESQPRLDLLAQNLSHNISRYILDYFKHVGPESEMVKHPEFNFENYKALLLFPEQSFSLKLGNNYDILCKITTGGDHSIWFKFETRSLNFLKFIDEHYYDISNIFKANIIAALPPVRRDSVMKNNHHFYMVFKTYKKYTPVF